MTFKGFILLKVDSVHSLKTNDKKRLKRTFAPLFLYHFHSNLQQKQFILIISNAVLLEHYIATCKIIYVEYLLYTQSRNLASLLRYVNIWFDTHKKELLSLITTSECKYVRFYLQLYSVEHKDPVLAIWLSSLQKYCSTKSQDGFLFILSTLEFR